MNFFYYKRAKSDKNATIASGAIQRCMHCRISKSVLKGMLCIADRDHANKDQSLSNFLEPSFDLPKVLQRNKCSIKLCANKR